MNETSIIEKAGSQFAMLVSSSMRRSVVLSLVVLTPLLAQSPTEKIVGGPYIVNDSPRSATVMWVVQTGQVTVSTEPGKPDKVIPTLRADKAVLKGLAPGKSYSYQAFPGEHGKGSFKTPPTAATPFEFVVFGDTRTRHDVHCSVIAAILKYTNPDFVMHTGDLVADGDDTALWPIYFDAERELLRKAAIFPSLGNHEHNARNYFDYMDARPYYSFDWGTSHFSVIDTDIENAGSTKAQRDAFWKEQTQWLEADLAAAQKAEFRFVFGHHPPMTAVERRQGDNPHMTALEPMFEKYKLTVGFFGHDHNYQHYLKNGIHYFVTGGGGAPLYDVNKPPAGITKKVETTENFLVVKIKGNTVRIEALRPNGSSIELTEVSR